MIASPLQRTSAPAVVRYQRIFVRTPAGAAPCRPEMRMGGRGRAPSKADDTPPRGRRARRTAKPPAMTSQMISFWNHAVALALVTAIAQRSRSPFRVVLEKLSVLLPV